LAFHTSANAYLLLGIPVTIVFERYVPGAPLRAKLVLDSSLFRLGERRNGDTRWPVDRPLSDLVILLRSRPSWVLDTWYFVPIIGLWPASLLRAQDAP
jgi:hypothetical protein